MRSQWGRSEAPPVIKHCWLEDTIFSSVMNSYWNLPFCCGFPIATFDYQRVMKPHTGNMHWLWIDAMARLWQKRDLSGKQIETCSKPQLESGKETSAQKYPTNSPLVITILFLMNSPDFCGCLVNVQRFSSKLRHRNHHLPHHVMGRGSFVKVRHLLCDLLPELQEISHRDATRS